MSVEQLLEELRHLTPDELERLKAGIKQRESELEQRPTTAEEWGKRIKQFLDEFWADTPEEEREAIIAAIRYREKPSDRTI